MRTFLPRFSSSVPTGLGGFLPIINLSIFLSLKRPCLFTSDSSTNNGLTRDSLTRDSLTHDGPDPQRFDLRRLGPAAPDGSAAGHLTTSATKPRSSKPRGSSLGSVFLLSSHWVRRFFIDLNLSVFPFVYCHLLQGFFPSIDLLSGFPPQSPVIGLGGFSPAT